MWTLPGSSVGRMASRLHPAQGRVFGGAGRPQLVTLEAGVRPLRWCGTRLRAGCLALKLLFMFSAEKPDYEWLVDDLALVTRPRICFACFS